MRHTSPIARAREENESQEYRAMVETIEIALDAKFGSSGVDLMPKVRRQGGLSELRKFVRFLKKAASLEEVREYLN